jgi:hypothetical protein
VDEQGWLTCDDPEAMLASLADAAGASWPGPDGPRLARPPDGTRQGCPVACVCCRNGCAGGGGLCPAYRKLRLLACSFCRRVLHLLPEPVCLRAVEAAERHADGAVDEAGWVRPAREGEEMRGDHFASRSIAVNAVYHTTHRRWLAVFDETLAEDRWRLVAVVARNAAGSAGPEEWVAQAALLRDVFGNPFRPPRLSPSLLTPTIVSLAKASYEERIMPLGHLDPMRLAILADALEELGAAGEAVGHLRSAGPHVRGCFVVDAVLGRD